MYYYEIFENFYQKQIKYLIIGGMAINLYGVPRVTQDLDIIISMDKDNVLKMNQALKELKYKPRLPVNPDDLAHPEVVKDWIENKNLKAFSFFHIKENYKVIDIILAHQFNFNEVYQNKTIKKVGSIEIYLISIDDLILMKQSVKRAQDLSDIEMLKKLKKWKLNNE
ncbi:MAG: DUF6036 family nucleotidyltransferase [Candidatus Helarchaeota archaeon]